MADLVTNTSQTQFGDIQIRIGTGGANVLLDVEIQDGTIPLNYDYKIFDSDLSDEISIVFSKNSNITGGNVIQLINSVVTVNVNGVDLFIGKVNIQSIYRNFANDTFSFMINSFDFDDSPYSGATGQLITFNDFLIDTFNQFGFTFNINTAGDSFYTLKSGVDVYIDENQAGGGDQVLNLRTTALTQSPKIKEVILALMVDLITIEDDVYIVPKSREGITPITLPTFDGGLIRQEYHRTDDFSENYSVSIMNYITTGKSTFYEVYSNDIITDEIDHINSWLSTATIDTVNWNWDGLPITGVPQITGGYNYLFDLNGYRLGFPGFTATAIQAKTLSLPSTEYDTLEIGDELLVNLHVWDVFYLNIYFRVGTSTELQMNFPENYNGNDGANLSLTYPIDADPTGADIEIRFDPNVDVLIEAGEGLRISNITYVGTTLTATTVGDPIVVGFTTATVLALRGVSGWENITLVNPPTSVTSTTITWTIAGGVTPGITNESSVFFTNTMLNIQTITVSDIQIGKNINMKRIPLSSAENVSNAVIYRTDSASDADDLDLVFRIMDKVIATAQATLGWLNKKFLRRVVYATKTESLGVGRPNPFDVYEYDGVDYKQIYHTINLKNGKIETEMTEI